MDQAECLLVVVHKPNVHSQDCEDFVVDATEMTWNVVESNSQAIVLGEMVSEHNCDICGHVLPIYVMHARSLMGQSASHPVTAK
jgi:hypothetical protein